MKIKRLVETENGEVEFEANLNADEVSFIMELGINILMAKGATLFSINTEEEPKLISEGTTTVQ